MSDQQVISSANLSRIEGSLREITSLAGVLTSEVGEVKTRVATLQGEHADLREQVAALVDDFGRFVRTAELANELQLAETRIVKVRQSLEVEFGHYAEVRRRSTGLLQALDAGLVTHDTIRHTTEDVMLKTPGYWLAPALVALAAWIRDDRPLAERAIAEALRRDDRKTAMFMSLILRRYGREVAATSWLQRYFQNQDPDALDREFVVLLDAVANGAFGNSARAESAGQIARWLEEVEARSGFNEAQSDRWVAAMQSFVLAVPDASYPILRKHSSTWSDLERSLVAGSVFGSFRQKLERVFDAVITPSPKLEEEIDGIISGLVSEFDSEEQPLRSEERFLQLIIDHGGDREVAETWFDGEAEAHEQTVDLPSLLTNAALHPEVAKASVATQRYALALGHDWMADAHERITAAVRSAVPNRVEIAIDGWQGASIDGRDEETLVSEHRRWVEDRAEEARQAVDLSPAAKIAPFVGGALVVYGVASMWAPVAILAGIAALVYWWFERSRLDERREAAADEVRERGAKAEDVLRAALAELVDVRERLAAQDAEAESLREYVAQIDPNEHALHRDATARAVIV